MPTQEIIEFSNEFFTCTTSFDLLYKCTLCRLSDAYRQS